MDKIIFRLILAGLFCGYFLHADEVYTSSVQLRGAAFFPCSERFRDVYGKVSSSFEIEGATRLCNQYDFWVNYDQFNKRSYVNDCGSTKVNLTTLSTGFKYTECLNCYLKGYVGLGVSFASILVKNNLCCFSTSSKKISVGGVFKMGLCLDLTDRLFLDFFGDYYYQPISYGYKTQCGGWRTGVGIGVVF